MLKALKPGDICFSRSNGLMAKLIRWGEWLSGGRGDWNHAFIIDRFEDGKWYVIQAEMAGVTNTAVLQDVDPNGAYIVMPPPKGVSRERLLAFARAQVGIEYGLGTDIAIGIDMLTWNWVPAFRGARKSSWICSALVAESLRFGGWYHQWIDIYCTTPQQLHDALVA